jgi:hypothetical protein
MIRRRIAPAFGPGQIPGAAGASIDTLKRTIEAIDEIVT